MIESDEVIKSIESKADFPRAKSEVVTQERN